MLNKLNLIMDLLLSRLSEVTSVWITGYNWQLAIGNRQSRVITLHFHRHPQPRRHHRHLKSLKRDKSTWAITQYRIVGVIVYDAFVFLCVCVCNCNIVSVPYLQLQLQQQLPQCECVDNWGVLAWLGKKEKELQQQQQQRLNNHTTITTTTNFSCNWHYL